MNRMRAGGGRCDTMTFILAGGAGERLRPLTTTTPKPLVPFGGVFRILDFTLSNCLNSRMPLVAVLSQFECQQIGHHLKRLWTPRAEAHATTFVHRPSRPDRPYAGTADAVRRNLDLALAAGASNVLVLSADHVYQADYGNLVAFHQRSGADVTVSSVRVPVADAHRFGVLDVEDSGHVAGFTEKPSCPVPCRDRPGVALASMGIYVFRTGVLIDALEWDRFGPASRPTDFGRDVLPNLLSRSNVMAWDYADVRGGSFWWDVGTVDGYHEAHMMSLDPGSSFRPFDSSWPTPPTDSEKPQTGFGGSFVPGSADIVGSVRRSVFSPGARVARGATVDEAVVLHDAEIGPAVRIRRAVVAPGVRIPEGEAIGHDAGRDRERFRITPGGIAIVDDASVFDLAAVPGTPSSQRARASA